MYKLLLSIVLLVCTTGSALAYNYIKPEEFRNWLETGRKVAIVDILPAGDFEKGHFVGAIETNAYPVKSAEEKSRLDPVAAALTASSEEVVIVCPRGGGGAKSTYDYLRAKGIEEKRLLILEKGAEGWPYRELLATGR
jgi:rhodanese-related sulfurtransferase